MNEKTVKSYIDRDFKRSKDIHKYAMLYASKFFRVINTIMRQDKLQQIISNRPYSWYFIKGFATYFIENGQGKESLDDPFLYRGLTKHFKHNNIIIDQAFISTTTDREIAKQFADTDGHILKFHVKHLPDDIKFVLINEKIAPYLMEDEILFLPGTININETAATYKADDALLHAINPNQSGGHVIKNKPSKAKLPEFLDHALMPPIELENKIAVFYRTAIGRSVELGPWVRLPKRQDKMQIFFRKVIQPMESAYEAFLDLIPDYKDALAQVQQTPATLSNAELHQLSNKCMSYRMMIAIYDPATKNIDDFDYGVPRMLRDEISQNLNIEAAIAIKKFCSWL